jgi:large subunit ribosomal protein L54
MICRTCLRRAAGFATRQITPRSLSETAPARTFSTTLCTRNAAPAAAAATPSAESRAPDLTPLTPSSSSAASEAAAAAAEKPRPISICAAGTPLNGLNYFKGRSDPVALPDEAYPDWLWNCLEVQKKVDAADDADAGDEFC